MTVVLIVDDSSVDRRLAGGLLEKNSEFSVEYASNATDALSQMEASLPDVVLTDLIMTSMDGLELVNQIRRRFPHGPNGPNDVAGQRGDCRGRSAKGRCKLCSETRARHGLDRYDSKCR